MAKEIKDFKVTIAASTQRPFYAAGHEFSTTPRTLAVVETPAEHSHNHLGVQHGADSITQAQLDYIREQPFLIVVEGADSIKNDAAIAALESQLAAALEENKTLKAQKAGLEAALQEAQKPKAK
jgi:hypothetical protein